MEDEEALKSEELDKLGLVLAQTRTEAIRGREDSGIERDWIEDEEFYEGIDEYNRGESAWSSKPAGRAGLQTVRPTGSTIFANITRPYCDAGSARIGDMLIPTDDKAFSINNTPLPDLIAIGKGDVPPKIKTQIGEAFPDNPEIAQKATQELVDETKLELDEANDRAKKSEQRIEDWLVECQYHSHVRNAIDDCGKAGSGVLKGPIPERRRTLAYMNGQLIADEEIVPVTRKINYWNFFPDPSCGDDIHRGNYVWERDDITTKELHKLTEDPNYLQDQLQKVLEEGPHAAFKEWKEGEGSNQFGLQKRKKKNLYEIWYYYGRMSREQAELAGCECKEDYANVHLTMVNNRVIRADLNHLDTGDFPYDIMVWQKRVDSPWGIGIARQIRVPQKILNAAIRNLMDNAGLAGGPMWIVLQGLVEPIDGKWELAPRKGWWAGEGADFDDARKAFHFITIDMVQKDLQAIIQLAMKMAEDITGLPMLLQGQQGAAPETVGGMTLLFNNATAVLRRLARLFDDKVTEPHIRRYYNYLLQYGNDEEKGDFQIDARGSSALVEREIQNQAIMQMGQMVGNPAFKIDPKKWRDEMMKAQHLDPKRFDYDDEEWEQLVQQILSAGQSDPRVQIEQMKIQAKAQQDEMGMAFKTQMDDRDKQFQAAMKQADQQFEVALKQIEAENDQRREAGQAELTVAQIQVKLQEAREKAAMDFQKSMEKSKADIAQTAMKLDTQIKLSGTEALTPPVEPRGRAEEGKSFQQ